MLLERFKDFLIRHKFKINFNSYSSSVLNPLIYWSQLCQEFLNNIVSDPFIENSDYILGRMNSNNNIKALINRPNQ